MSFYSRVNRSRKGRRRGKGSTTTTLKGTAMGDMRFSLPLLGRHFQHKHMLYYDPGFERVGTGGVLTTYFFRANDVYDPDATGTGHQPVGFDQAMLFWEQFCVFGSKITVNFMNNSFIFTRVGICLSPDQTLSDVHEIMENGYNVSTVLQGATSTQVGGFNAIKMLSLSCDNPKYFSSKNKETYFANPNFTGTAAASPAEMNYYCVYTFCNNGNNNTDVFFDVELSYDVRFWEPRKIANSLLLKTCRQVRENEQLAEPVLVPPPSETKEEIVSSVPIRKVIAPIKVRRTYF